MRLPLLWRPTPRTFHPRRIFEAAQAFVGIEASSGIVLLLAAIAALVWANSPWSDSYGEFWHTHIILDLNVVRLDEDLRHWVNDALMTLFFFLAGLEIKREVSHGELSSPRRAALPAAAALGGMIVPALIYAAFNAGTDGSRGWGIPMATDIAFALGVLSLLSGRIPFSLKVFLLALAIVDDIGAILVIAVFYSSSIDFEALGLAAAVLAAIIGMNRFGVRNIMAYTVVGSVLWLLVFESGLHATLAGVALGLLAPANPFYRSGEFTEAIDQLVEDYEAAHARDDVDGQLGVIAQMEDLSQGSVSTVERLERELHAWVSYLIVPLFALANAGVELSGESIRQTIDSPVAHGVTVGLVVGKPIGICLACFLAIRLKLCSLPTGATWPQVFGVGTLAGIGFTVSLLISDLAFDNGDLVREGKIGILAASLIAGVLGLGLLWLTRAPNVDGVASAELSEAREPESG
jgi:NhaA family Na+:H+ antiporter